MRRLAPAIICLVAGWLLAFAAHSGELQLGGEGRYDLTPSLHFLQDPSQALRVEEVDQPARRNQFQPVRATGPGANFGFSASAYWLRATVHLPPGAPRQWMVELAYPPLDEVDVYSRGPAGWVRHAGGDSRPFLARAVPHRHHVFPVELAPGANTLYLRIASQGTLSAPVRLWRPQALWSADQASYASLSLYFGLLVGLLLYNLLLYVSVRERAYLAYGAFVAAMGMGQAALSGLGAQFLWPHWDAWNRVSSPVSLSLSAIFGLVFVRSFLSSSARLPRLDRFLKAQIAGWGLSVLAALLLPYTASTYLVTVLALLSVATMTIVGVASVRSELAGARYFALAWTVLLVGVTLLTMHNVGALPSNAFTANSLLIGSALEMVLLSFALGDRMNVARRFKEQAQARIAAEHAMVEALAQSQDRLKQVLDERERILDNSLVGIVFLTPDGRFKWANKAMLDIFGAGHQPVTSMEPFYLSREQYLQVGGEVAQAVGRGEVYERELPVRRWDGSRIWIQLSGKAVNRSDLSQGTVWVIMDITERKQLEEQLRQTMSEREAILNTAVVGIVLSVRRRHEWVNDKFAQMLGYPKQVLIGQPSSYIHPDEASWLKFGEGARAALIEHNAYTCERQLKHRNGQLFWVEMGGSCIRPYDPDAGVIWTFLDITERKRSDEQMREALEQQRALNELRSRFVAMTSHEFRTPLAAILSAEEVLRHYGDRLSPSDRKETLDSIANGVQRMSRMMDRVLLIGQAEAQMLDFEPRPHDLRALCRQLVDEARAQHPHSRCEVVAQWGPGVGEGLWDDKLLRHIFGNLLSNAIKYSPEGGQVRLDVRREGAEMVFVVSDRGIGIPPDEIPHLFESFHRASNVGSIQGTGLGLAIARNAVETHRGHIEVDSRLGEGTRFTVRLPVVPQPVAA